MRTKRLIITVLAVFLVTGLSGCQYLKKRVEKKEKVSYTLSSNGKQRIEIDNDNGNVDIITTNDTLGVIYIVAEKTGKVRINESDKPIEGIEINIDSTGDVIRIDTDFKRSHSLFGHDRDAKVNYTIKVPASLNVQVSLTNGTISADGIVSSSRFETVNGPIYLSKCSGIIDLETVNGSIKANIDSVKSLTAETVNGSITLGSLKYTNANVEAECINGKVKSENLNFTNMTSEKRSLNGRLGTGGGLIKLSTVNGSIKLDGNYISYKKKDNIDWDFKFEFDDNDEPVKIKIEDTDEQKGVGITPKDSVRRADSIKSK